MTPRAPRPAIVVMAKEPRPGFAKTRLVPPLTPEEAARIYECFLLDALEHARSLAGATPLVAVWPPESTGYFERVAPDLGQVAQVGQSLAERLDHVLTRCLDDGFVPVVVINSDSPTLPRSRLDDAMSALFDDDTDMVLGPAADGGYYLIGWKRAYPHLVRDIAMSTPRVLRETLAMAEDAGVRVALLDPWYDVDEPADLDRLRTEIEQASDECRHTARFLRAEAMGRG